LQSLRDYFSRIARHVGLIPRFDDLSLASRLVNGRGVPPGARELFEAAANGHVSDIEDILRTGGSAIKSVLNDALALAARNGRAQAAAFLIEEGADVHELSDEPLRWAAEAGHTTTVEILLKAGANPHIRDDIPLRSAVANGHADTAALLQNWRQPP
jgi:hypothetical protein